LPAQVWSRNAARTSVEPFWNASRKMESSFMGAHPWNQGRIQPPHISATRMMLTQNANRDHTCLRTNLQRRGAQSATGRDHRLLSVPVAVTGPIPATSTAQHPGATAIAQSRHSGCCILGSVLQARFGFGWQSKALRNQVYVLSSGYRLSH
jgi:hypothetical protein